MLLFYRHLSFIFDVVTVRKWLKSPQHVLGMAQAAVWFISGSDCFFWFFFLIKYKFVQMTNDLWCNLGPFLLSC